MHLLVRAAVACRVHLEDARLAAYQRLAHEMSKNISSPSQTGASASLGLKTRWSGLAVPQSSGMTRCEWCLHGWQTSCQVVGRGYQGVIRTTPYSRTWAPCTGATAPMAGDRCGLQTAYGAMRGQRMPSDAHDRQPGNSPQQKPRTVSSRLGWLRCWCMHRLLRRSAYRTGAVLRFACARCVGCGESADTSFLYSTQKRGTACGGPTR